MEGRTPTEKVQNLSNIVASQTEQLPSLSTKGVLLESELARTIRELAESKHSVIRLEEQLAELRRWKADMAFVGDLKTEVAILRREVDKLEKVKEEWGRRVWAMTGPVLGAIVGWILGYFSRK